jgi:predicted dehydrogenase
MTPVSILGCGLIGGKRASALPAGFEVVSLFDPVTERAHTLSGQLGGRPVVCSELATALDRASGGVAIVATTHDALAGGALAALDAGCDILIEKPGGKNVDETRAIALRAGELGRVVAVGFNHRFHPSIRDAHSIIDNERLGPILFIRAQYGHGGRLGYETEWRCDRQRSGGGELIDQGVHLIDLTRHFAGDLQLSYAALDTMFWPIDVEDNAFLHLRAEDGGHAWLHASWTEWKNLFSFEIMCKNVKIEINGLGGSYGPERLAVHRMSAQLGPPTITTVEYPPGDSSWSRELNDFAARRRGEPSVGASIDDAVAALEIVKEAYR